MSHLYRIYLDEQSIVGVSSISAGHTSSKLISGCYTWCIAIPESLSGHPNLFVQVNYSNYNLPGQSIVNAVRAGTHYPGAELLPTEAKNPNFDNNWITIDSITTGQTYYFTTKPVRFVRLKGSLSADGVSGAATANFGSNNFYAHVWSTAHIHGQ